MQPQNTGGRTADMPQTCTWPEALPAYQSPILSVGVALIRSDGSVSRPSVGDHDRRRERINTERKGYSGFTKLSVDRWETNMGGCCIHDDNLQHLRVVNEKLVEEKRNN